MLKVIDFVTLIIAVTALIISIVCMNKKCDNFGDTTCDENTHGTAKINNSCVTRKTAPSYIRYNCDDPRYSQHICGKNLTCDDNSNKCINVDDNNKEQNICQGNLNLCPGSGPTPSSDCPAIKFVCNNSKCPDCKQYQDLGCKVINIPNFGKSICGDPNVPTDPDTDYSFAKLCTSDGINCNPDDKTDNNICKKFCEPLTGNESTCSWDGYCQQRGLFTDVKM